MPTTIDFESRRQAALTGRVCRVAYTLNNDQPVRCTIIGDEPLFFMDYEGAADEEADMQTGGGDFGFDAVDRGIRELEDKINALERLADRDHEKAVGDTLEMFFETARVLTDSAEYGLPDIKDLVDVIGTSRTAGAYLDFARQHGTSLSYSRQVPGACYERSTHRILINPDLPAGDQYMLAARELRRVWQHRQGALIHPLVFHPDQALLVNRVQIADLTTAMVRVAWELQLAGHRESWLRLESSSMNDLAYAFAREAALDFRTLNDGRAAAAVFEAWFLSERCAHEDKVLIQQMLADYQGYVFESAAPPQSVTVGLIAALGTQPFGKNYLSAHAAAVISDPVFTEVRDRANANFLWFIKFERSFRESARHLQPLSPAGSSPADPAPNQEIKGDDAKAGEIIVLSFPGRDARTASDARGPDHRGR